MHIIIRQIKTLHTYTHVDVCMFCWLCDCKLYDYKRMPN